MGGILVYQREERKEPVPGEQSGQIIIVSEAEQAVRILEEDHYQMVMIHLDQKGSGFALASMVRGIPGYELTPVLFLATDRRHEKRAFYEYHCYDYLVKPIRKEEVIKILYPYLVQCHEENRKNWMRVRVHGVTRRILICDILYMESINRSVDIHMRNGVLNIPYLQLKQCLKKYEDIFIQCHRSILVNRNFVRGIDYRDKKVELPGCQVDIGRQYETGLRREFDGRRTGCYNGTIQSDEGGADERDISYPPWAAVQ